MGKTKLGGGSKATVDVTMIDQWLAEHYRTPEDIVGKGGLLAQLTRAVVERALGAELTHHLGYAPGADPAPAGGNCRNGTSPKTLVGEAPRAADIMAPEGKRAGDGR